MARGSRPPRQKPTQVPVALPDRDLAQGNWLRNFRMSGFTVIILSLTVLGIVVLAPSLRNIIQQQQQIAALNASLANQKHKVQTLQGDIDRWSDPAYIEAQARDRLLYVYPGDYTYLVIDDGKTQTTRDGAPISSTIQTTRVDWLHALLSTVVQAGLTTDTANQLEAPRSSPSGGSR